MEISQLETVETGAHSRLFQVEVDESHSDLGIRWRLETKKKFVTNLWRYISVTNLSITHFDQVVASQVLRVLVRIVGTGNNDLLLEVEHKLTAT